jgi:hypothetical protein
MLVRMIGASIAYIAMCAVFLRAIEPSATFYGVATVVALCFTCVVLLWVIVQLVKVNMRHRKGFSAFEVDDEKIIRRLKGHPDIVGKWSELAFVDPHRELLYFSDGTTIKLRYGGGVRGIEMADALSDAEWDLVLQKSKLHTTILMDAMLGYKESVPTRKDMVLILFFFIIASIVSAYSIKIRPDMLTLKIIYASSALLGIGYVILLETRPLRVAKKFAPPSDWKH